MKRLRQLSPDLTKLASHILQGVVANQLDHRVLMQKLGLPSYKQGFSLR